MPIYDYRCSNCGHRAEILHGVHDESARVCPDCGGQMRKAITAPAVVFKGSGWAKVDRRSSSHRKAAEGDGEAATPAAATSGSDSSTGGESAASSDSSAGSTTTLPSESRSSPGEKRSKGTETASGTKSKASAGND